MRYWWVSQNVTYDQEVPGGYMWSPKRNQGGGRNPYYDFMQEMAPGDVVFSFADTYVKAIGIVEKAAYDSEKPSGFGEQWEKDGWRVDVKFQELGRKIRPRDHMDRLSPLRPQKYSPLKADGDGNLLYLTTLPDDFAEALISIIGTEAQAAISKLRSSKGLVRRVGPPAVWRLIAHHEAPAEAFKEMVARSALAVGWSLIGDLRNMDPRSAKDISGAIPIAHPGATNANLGGASLWNFLYGIQVGDLVIVAGNGVRMGVFEVLGDYYYSSDSGGILDYRHQRAAVLTEIDADELWASVDGDVAKGQNFRWTLALCRANADATKKVFHEGDRYEVRSTAVERNPAARKACIDHHGPACFVCEFDFGAKYGEIGAGYIHVHHRTDIALSNGRYAVDPLKDLVPLCPNCHAMVHTTKPAMSPEDLKAIIGRRRQPK